MGLSRTFLLGSLSLANMVDQEDRQHAFFMGIKVLKNWHDAEDCAQDAMLNILATKTTCNFPSKRRNWVNSVAYRSALTLIRSNFRKKGFSVTLIEEIPGEEEDLDFELPELIESAIQKIKPLYAKIVRRFYLEEKTYLEISKELNIPVGTVKSRLNHARERLKLVMREADFF